MLFNCFWMDFFWSWSQLITSWCWPTGDKYVDPSNTMTCFVSISAEPIVPRFRKSMSNLTQTCFDMAQQTTTRPCITVDFPPSDGAGPLTGKGDAPTSPEEHHKLSTWQTHLEKGSNGPMVQGVLRVLLSSVHFIHRWLFEITTLQTVLPIATGPCSSSIFWELGEPSVEPCLSAATESEKQTMKKMLMKTGDPTQHVSTSGGEKKFKMVCLMHLAGLNNQTWGWFSMEFWLETFENPWVSAPILGETARNIRNRNKVLAPGC